MITTEEKLYAITMANKFNCELRDKYKDECDYWKNRAEALEKTAKASGLNFCNCKKCGGLGTAEELIDEYLKECEQSE